MEISLLQYYKNNQITLLKQFLLTIPLFNQINYFLSSTQFDQFLKYLEIQEIQYSIPFELSSKCTYLFLCTGNFVFYKNKVFSLLQKQGILLSKKQKKQNYQKLSRLSRTVKFSNMLLQRQMLSQQNQRQSQKIKTTQINQLFNQSLFFSNNPSGNNQFFICNEQRKTAIIVINHSKIPQTILNQIKEKHNQKFKFLGNSTILKNIQKNIIQNNLNSFKVLKVSFDEFILKKQSLRNNCVFFLTFGSVQVCIQQNKETKKYYITQAPSILGLQNTLYAKSVTQSCQCYYIEKNTIIEMLKKNMQGRYKNSETQQQLKMILKSIQKQKIQNVSNSLPEVTPRKNHLRQQRSNTTPVNLSNLQQQNSSLFKQKQNLSKIINNGVSENKKFRIKQHFTNFMNDKYQQFACKKSQFISKKMQNNSSVLYEMKSLVVKQPEMSLIKQKLKIQRLKKIQRCKQNILLTKQQSLNSVNLRLYEEFQNTKILNKIRRKIQYNIDKKQRRNKQWKSYIPNNASFNRLSDFSIGI